MKEEYFTSLGGGCTWSLAPLATAPKTINLTLIAFEVRPGSSVKTAATYKTWKGMFSMKAP
jgi:hypothetical protein